ncbi:MAG: hypothetical protein ABSF59_10765 [Candidatus Sulfotelmatobacter sp.]|jgi:hypothetical protein
MGLDAVVFCDCVEKNRLKVPHPFPKLLFVEVNGSPEIRSKTSAKINEHDEWMALPPCQHEGMMVAGAYIGNATFVERVRYSLKVLLKPPPPRCPVLLGKVLYCGTHTGDYLTLAQVRRLAAELQQLKEFDLENTEISSTKLRSIRSVATKLRRLTNIALEIKKPIAF